MALLYRGPFLLVHAVSALTRELLDRHLEGSGLNANEFAVYSVIAAEGRIHPTRLAETVGIPATSMSYVISQMEKRGHVRRIANPGDRRSVLLELAARGAR